MLFRYVCELLEELYAITTHDPLYLPKDSRVKQYAAIARFFATHRGVIDRQPGIGVALLSALLPERRTDRVYGLQSRSLEKIIGRALGLSASRIESMGRWREPGFGDLAECVERVQRESVSALSFISSLVIGYLQPSSVDSDLCKSVARLIMR